MMTTSIPDVQALIEGLASIRSSQANSGWMIEEDLESIAQAEEVLSALSGETGTELAKAELRGFNKGYAQADREWRQSGDGRGLA